MNKFTDAQKSDGGLTDRGDFKDPLVKCLESVRESSTFYDGVVEGHKNSEKEREMKKFTDAQKYRYLLMPKSDGRPIVAMFEGTGYMSYDDAAVTDKLVEEALSKDKALLKLIDPQIYFSVPPGWRLVPEQPTKEILEAMYEVKLKRLALGVEAAKEGRNIDTYSVVGPDQEWVAAINAAPNFKP